ncbi:MAG: metallophosphoesterase [Candidatus Aminicenantaceae bacterium]
MRQLKKHQFPGTSIFILLVIFLWCGPLSGLSQDAPLAITHGPYLQNPSPNGMTIIWFTSRECVSQVDFGEGGSLDRVARTSRHGLFAAYSTQHQVRLEGLEPGKTYSYRVVSKEFLQFEPYDVQYGDSISSELNDFRTLDRARQEYSFIVINDVHERADELDRKLQRLDWQGIDLVFLNGDIINHFEHENQIFEGFLDVCVDRFAREVPFVWIRGNHETRGLLARALPEFVDTPGGLFYYTLQHGPVQFVILDSGEDKPDTHEVYAGLVDFDAYRDEQAAWLQNVGRDRVFKKAPFKIVIFHIPPFGGNDWYGELYLRDSWGPVLERAKTDLLVCAHTHRFKYLEPEKGQHGYPVLVGGKDTVIRADVSGKRVAITVFDADGQVIHTMSLD